MVAILSFELDGHRFGLRAADVLEVLRAATPTPLPSAPAIVTGVLNVRGTLFPVLDVRVRFGFAGRPLLPADRLILTEAASSRIAFAVDSVEALVELDPAAIAAPSELPEGGPHVAGVAKLPDGLILIYDLARFLSQAEADALVRALAQHEADEDV